MAAIDVTPEWEQADSQSGGGCDSGGFCVLRGRAVAPAVYRDLTQIRYGYEGVKIDEERILGLEVRLLPFLSPYIDVTMSVSQTIKYGEDEIYSFCCARPWVIQRHVL